MIEKKIHYIWFGGEKPEKVKRCIESWYKYLPDYEIIEWNERNIDIEKEKKKNKFFKYCYENKIFGVMTDYLRTNILYNSGGIYLDADIEVIKSFDKLLENKFFMGYENNKDICYAVIGSIPKHPFLEKMKKFYESEVWKSDIYISGNIIDMILKRDYFKEGSLEEEGIKLYPAKYFYPYHWTEKFDEKCVTEDTYAIHHWDGSWTLNPNIAYLRYKHLNPILRFFKVRRKIKKINKEIEKRKKEN